MHVRFLCWCNASGQLL